MMLFGRRKQQKGRQFMFLTHLKFVRGYYDDNLYQIHCAVPLDDVLILFLNSH